MSVARVFKCGLLANMVAVGSVDTDGAQIWFRAEAPGTFKVSWREERGQAREEFEVEIPADNASDNTIAVHLPAGKGRSTVMESNRRYRYRVERIDNGRLVGEGCFETAPASADEIPRKFSIALMSCHQPFDSQGRLTPLSARMLRAARTCIREHNTKFVFSMGDQMYADFPEGFSLFDRKYFRGIAPQGRETIFDCTAEEVRRIYQSRYRQFWNQEEWRALHAETPFFPILDDHDIVDNWGSRPEHQEPKWRAVGDGATRAYFDYQGSRVIPFSPDDRPESFHYSFVYGNTASFVMDLRSNRRAGDDGQLYGDLQERDLREFLENHRQKQVLFIVVSVPVVHLPRFIARFIARLPHTGEDFSDRWSSGSHLRDRDRFLKIIHDHRRRCPAQQIVLLSGDIHIGCVHVIRWNDDQTPVYQMISSPVTHGTPWAIQVASKAIISANRSIATDDGRLKASVGALRGRGSNPFGKTNFGLIELETPEAGASPRLRFKLYGELDGRPVCVFASPAV